MRPYRILGGFTTDANGNGSETRRLPTTASSPASASVSVQSSGSGQWTFGTQAGAEKFSTGTGNTLGPIILGVGDQAVTSVMGAQPNTTTTLIYTGWISDTNDGSDLFNVASGAQFTAGSAANQQVTLATLGPSALGSHVPVPISPDIQGIQLVPIAGSATSLSITGQTSGRTYLVGAFSAVTGPFAISDIDSSVDSAVTISWAGSTNFTFDLVGLRTSVSVLIQNDTLQPIPIVPPEATLPNAVLAFSVNMSSTGITHVIPAALTKTVHLFSINAVVSVAGAFAGMWQDTSGTVLHNETLQNGGPRHYAFSGVPLTTNLGVDFNVTAAGASFYQGSIVYNQS